MKKEKRIVKKFHKLQFTDEAGNKKCLTINEVEDFKCQFPKIAKFFDNPELLLQQSQL